ncbi:porin [Chitinibacteraceae bacterium HSL-7]
MKKKLITMSIAAALASTGALADVSLSGSAEMDFFYRTNTTPEGDGSVGQEIAIILNLDGSDKLDSGDTLKWRLAQKVATDYRYDSFGQREAWIGYAGNWGELRFGNQFSNLYLTLDWPYGAQGQSNLWADFGAQSVNYARAVSYFSPNFGGFSFQTQYDLGSGNSDAYAWEATGNYRTGGLSVDAGYTQAKNNGNASSEAFTYGGSSWGSSGDYTKDNKSSVAFGGVRYAFASGFDIGAGYKHNRWEGDVNDAIHAGNGETTVDQYAVRGGYTTGRHNFNLGYQRVSDSETDGVKTNDGMDVVNAQYNYTLSKNTVAFAQVRHHMLDDGSKPSVMHGSWQLDGFDSTSGKDSSTRFLVGTWTSF